MIFAALPSAFPKLQAMAESMDAVVIAPPPPIEAIGKRLRSAYAISRPDGYRGLAIGQLRKLPYAYWLSPDKPLHEVEALLVQRYWAQDLPNAIKSGARREKRWLTPLFFVYCEAFDPSDEWFHDFARRLSAILPNCEGAFAERLMYLQREVSFFSPAKVASRLADALMSHQGHLDDAFESYLLWPQFADTQLGAAVFSEALELDELKFSDWNVIERVLEWSKRLAAPISKTAYRVKFADALLKPWLRRQPPDKVKTTLVDFFVRVYGDPRMLGNRQYHWRDVSPQSLSVLMTWLAGDTLRGFMRVLESTADDIWRYRQKFWMAYYNAGHVQEAWLALGYQAGRLAERLKSDQRGLGYGQLEGGALPNHSVLLLKIGHLVFTEWSHNGSLRAFSEDDPNSPGLYQDGYHGDDLRAAVSMDFHDGMNERPQLTHSHSDRGTWQRKARDFIRRETGIHLEDWDIL